MFGRMIDDLKESTGVVVRLTSLAAAIALAFFITISFLCAAAFVYVLQTYGLIEACLTGAGIFLFIALIGIAVYAMRKKTRPAASGRNREVRDAHRPCRSDAGGCGDPGGPRDRRQKVDPDPGRGWPRTRFACRPFPVGSSDASRMIASHDQVTQRPG